MSQGCCQLDWVFSYYLSIHSLLFVTEGLEAIPATTGREASYTLDRSAIPKY